MTVKKVAKEINTLQPDLTEFWKIVTEDEDTKIFDLTKNVSVTLFMLELYEIYTSVHPTIYQPFYMKEKITQYRESIKFYGPTIKYLNITSILKDREQYSKLISAHVNNFKQYLNPYLYKKFGFTKSRQKAIMELEENEFSLELFKNALGKRKMPSTEGIKYFEQVQRFKQELRDKFMDVIFEHCKQPSIEFHRVIEESNKFSLWDSTPSKYINLSRQLLRYLSSQINIPLSYSFFDTQDARYVPFTCGVPRKPTPSRSEVEALVSTLILIQNSDHSRKNYIIKCLKDHLAHPEYTDELNEYKKRLIQYSNNLMNVLKDI